MTKASLVLGCMLGCAPTSPSHARLETEVCRKASPVAIFELGSGAEARMIERVASRFIVRGPPQVGTTSGDTWRYASVGSCGEELAVIEAEGLFSTPEFGVFACGSDGRIGKVDPEGQVAIEWFAEGLSCGIAVAPDAVVAVDPATGQLVWVDTAGERWVLAENAAGLVPEAGDVDFDPIRVQRAGSVLGVVDDEAVLHVIDGEIGRVDFTVEGVTTFAVAPGGGFVVVSGTLEREAALWSRPTGATTTLPAPVLAHASHVRDAWILLVSAQAEFHGAYEVETGAVVTAPGAPPTAAQFIADGRVALEASDGIRIWDPVSGETTALIDELPALRLYNEDGIWFADSTDDLLGTPMTFRFLSYEGGEPLAFEEPMTVGATAALPGGSAVYLEAAEGADTGTLLWQRAGGEVLIVDEDVSTHDESRFFVDLADRNDVVYYVDRGEESGLWRAALPQ